MGTIINFAQYIADYIIKLLDVISWHHLAFVLVFVFRQQISDLINRIRRIGRDGFEADSIYTLEQQENIESISEIQTKDNINEELKNLPDERKFNKLIEELVKATISLSFEEIYSAIFGSQIDLLFKLNERPNSGMSSDEVNLHINVVKTLYPNQFREWSNEQYLVFLCQTSSLVNRKDDRYFITEKGTNFITWIISNSRSRKKPL